MWGFGWVTWQGCSGLGLWIYDGWVAVGGDFLLFLYFIFSFVFLVFVWCAMEHGFAFSRRLQRAMYWEEGGQMIFHSEAYCLGMVISGFLMDEEDQFGELGGWVIGIVAELG